MEDRTKSLTRYFFTWNIKNYGSCVKYIEGLESPAFQLWSPRSSWNLLVKVGNTNEIRICLCRQFMGVGARVINARFLLCLKTLHGTEMWKNESGWLSFTEGSSIDSEILFVPLSSETDETIVVTCDIFLITKAYILRNNPSLKQLENLEKIFNNSSSTQNIVLNFGKQEKSISFSKRKLEDHCKEFERIFKHCGREFEIRNYSPDVIKSLLKFLHFKKTYLANDRNLFELWPCALEFVALNLINILQPEFLYRTSELSLEDRVYKWNYCNFRETPGTSYSIETTEINLANLGTSNICTHTTRLRLTMHSDMVENSENRGITVLYTHIRNLPVDSRFVIEISVCDNTDYIYFKGITLLKPDSKGIFRCYSYIANEALFGTGNPSFPRHIKFNFKSGILQDLTDNSRPKQM